MIAAAMATRNPSAPTYFELARAEASIRRNISPPELLRLAEVSPDVTDVEAELSFAIDDRGRPLVKGVVRAALQLPCHLCTELVAVQLEAPVQGLLASDEAEAQSWSVDTPDCSTIVVAGRALDIGELVEDELLLVLPQRVCVDESCDRRPQMDFGPPVSEREPYAESTAVDNPFAVLSRLKSEAVDATASDEMNKD